MLHEEKWVCQRCRAVGEIDVIPEVSGDVIIGIVDVGCAKCGSDDTAFNGTAEQRDAFVAAYVRTR